MATVYRAMDHKHHRPVAVKVLDPGLAAALGPERFLREIEIAARLDHPHILPLHDSGEANGFLYYVMPFVEGESLRARLERERQLPLDDALTIAREVADALSYAHSRGVVHRDVKPENILLAGGHARVADFGIARAITAAGGDRVTATGIAIGTPTYMSPEQAAGSADLDGRSDLYSLGCVLYEMLTGAPPFTGPTTPSVVHQHLAATPAPVTSLRPAVPAHVAAALQRALAKLPADRFNPAGQFAEALRSPTAPPAAAQGREQPAAGRRPRWAVLAALAATLIAGGVILARAAGLGRASSLIETGRFGERERVILADFESDTDPSHGATVTELLRVALAQSPAITLLDPSQVGRLLELMRRDPEDGVPVAVALEAAERGGLGAVVSGEVRAVGSQLAVAARIVAPSGEVLVTHQEIAPGADGLVQAVHRLSNALRARIGESLRSIRRAPPLDQVTTGSMRALRLYALGMQASNRGDDVRAVHLFAEAIAIDSVFAMAYRKLAIVLSNRGESRSRAVDAAVKAYEHRDRLTERERLTVAAAYHTVVSGNHDETIRAYRTLLDVHPDDVLALNNLGVVYGQLREWERAADLYARALLVDSTVSLYYGNLAGALNALRRFDSAAAVLNLFAARFPDNPDVLIARIIHAANRKDYAAARRMGDSLMAAQRGTVFWEATAYEWLASLAATHGQLDLARRHWERSLGLSAERRLPGPYLTRAARRAITEALLGGDRERGRAIVTEAMSRFPLERLDPLDRPYPHLALALAWVDRPDAARRLLAEYEATPEADHGREARLWTLGAAGAIALAEGRTDEALAAFRQFDERSGCETCAYAWLARAYDRAGQTDSARVFYERTVNTPSAQIWYDAGHLAHSYRRLGELYGARQDIDRAAGYYQRFLELWRDADPRLRPQVAAAEAALGRLTGETVGVTP